MQIEIEKNILTISSGDGKSHRKNYLHSRALRMISWSELSRILFLNLDINLNPGFWEQKPRKKNAQKRVGMKIFCKILFEK